VGQGLQQQAVHTVNSNLQIKSIASGLLHNVYWQSGVLVLTLTQIKCMMLLQPLQMRQHQVM
jgi:hypothetical protein